MQVRIINNSQNPLPKYATIASAGMDLCANNASPIELLPMQRVLIPTGLFLEIPIGFEAQVRPRSGLALKHGVALVNSPGTIDADYRGEVGVLLINLGDVPFVISTGDRIAQLVVAKHESVVWQLVEVLDQTQRGAGGFGHTGKS